MSLSCNGNAVADAVHKCAIASPLHVRYQEVAEYHGSGVSSVNFRSGHAASWSPQPIKAGTIPVLRQPVFLKAWEGAKGRDNARAQANYLLKEDCFLFTSGGRVIEKHDAYGFGETYGQQRIIVSPFLTDGLDDVTYIDRLAELWGLNEHGWYAVFHTDRPHHHWHVIAERETRDGRKLALDRQTLMTWQLHAQRLSTSILGLFKGAPRQTVKAWEADNDDWRTWETANAA